MVVANAAPEPDGPAAANPCLSDCAHVPSLLRPRLAHSNAASWEDLSHSIIGRTTGDSGAHVAQHSACHAVTT